MQRFWSNTAINSLEQKFSQLQHHSNYFSFLFHVYELKDVSSVILANCKDLETILTNRESSDINSLVLSDEISELCSLLEIDLTTFGSFEDSNIEFCSRFSIFLRILITHPISVASGERSFPKLKIIKNYWWTTSEERL